MTLKSLSLRAQTRYNTVPRIDAELSRHARNNLYDIKHNPNGAIMFNIAENRLCWDILKAKIEQTLSTDALPDWVALYTSDIGHASVRAKLAAFLSRHLTHCTLDPEHLLLSSGAGAVIAISSLVAADPGDAAVIPAPAFLGYQQDISLGSLIRYDMCVDQPFPDKDQSLSFRLEDLYHAKQTLEQQGKQFKVLILTSPDNPTGRIITRETYELAKNFCLEHHIHLFVNEIYGLSRIDIEAPEIKADYNEQIPLFSFAQMIEQEQSPYLHLWYSLSKDFGVSGFRVGIMYTRNRYFRDAFDNYSGPFAVSNLTQWLMGEILSDNAFITDYIKTNQARLTQAYIKVVKCLKQLNIPYCPSRGSLFIWADFGRFLDDQTTASELKLWQDIYHQSGVLFAPGAGFGQQQVGLFRLAYSAVTDQELDHALDRLTRFFDQC